MKEKVVMNIRKFGRRLARDTRGANLVEYIMLVGLVALLSVIAFRTFGGNIQAKIEAQGSEVTNIGSK